MSGLQEKIFNYAIKAVAGLLAGGGALQLSTGGKHFGKLVFLGFTNLGLPSVDFLGRHYIGEGLYRTWGGKLANEVLPFLFHWRGLALLALLLLLIAHAVAMRPKSKTRESGKTPRLLLTRVYIRYYRPLTVVLLFTFTVGIFTVSNTFLLVACFLLAGLPSVLYLVYHSKDVLKGSYGDRFTYAAAFFLLVVALVGAPISYGRGIFDVRLFPVQDVQPQERQGFSIGTFVFGENRVDDKRLYCEVFYVPKDDRVVIKFFEPSGPVNPDFLPFGEPLRKLIENREDLRQYVRDTSFEDSEADLIQRVEGLLQ